METLDIQTTLARMTCGECGVPFAIPASMRAEKLDSGGGWYCPNGHPRVFSKTNEAKLREAEERLAEERRRVQATRELLAAEERSHVATRGHLTRVKKRAAAGVCPCCNRTFQNVQRHLSSKHPDYVSAELAHE